MIWRILVEPVVTGSSEIDHSPPWDSNLRPTHQRLYTVAVRYLNGSQQILGNYIIIQSVHTLQLGGAVVTDSLSRGSFHRPIQIYFPIT